MSAGSIVNRNFLALASGEAVSRLVAFGVTVYVARILGAEGYGVMALAVGITLYLSKIAEFSIETIGSKELAKARTSQTHLVSSVMSVRLVIATVSAGMAILASQVFLTDPERTIISLYFLTVIPIAANTKWVFLGMEDTRPVGLLRVAGELVAMGLVVYLVRNENDLWGAPVAQIAGELSFAALLILILRKRGCKFTLCWDPAITLPIFAQALPLLGHTMLWLIIYNSDLLFLRLFRNGEAVGHYAAAYMLISFLTNIGISYGVSLLPTFARLGAGSPKERVLYQTGLAQVYAVFVPACLGVYLLASHLIEFGFGEGYTRSVAALEILIWCVPVSVVRMVPWAALIARGCQNSLLKATGYSVIANIVLNTLLVPKYGIIGAAVATVITEFFTGVLLFRYAAHRTLTLTSIQRFWRPTLASFLMAGALVALRPNLALGLVLGLVVYTLALALFGGICFRKGKMPALSI